MKAIYTLLILLIPFVGFGQDSILDDWSNYNSYNINTSENYSDAVIYFILNNEEVMNDDYSDIRIQNSNDENLNYWIEYFDNNFAKVWVKVPFIYDGDNILNVFYGNSTALSQSNGNNVFEFFDDFNVSILDEEKWLVTSQSGASYSITGSELIMNVTQTDNFISVDSGFEYDL